MVLHTKYGLSGYPFILGRPWLETIDAYISCILGDMTMTHGQSLYKLILYPPVGSFLEIKEPLWVCPEEEDALFGVVSHPILTIDKSISLKDLHEYTMNFNLMQNHYPSEV